VDEDGKLESWELENFYNDYDLNEDGTVDEYELEKAKG